MLRKAIWFLITVLSFSCNRRNDPNGVRLVLEKAEHNRSELENAIDHYSEKVEDSLKLKACYYLIENMDDWHYYDGELLEHYQEYIKLISRDQNHGPYFLASLEYLYGPFDYEKLDVRHDINEVKSEQLIGNIDAAFKVWKEQPWGKDISFQSFCEYILPYRIGEEKPEYNRIEIYKQFNPILDSVRKAGGDAIAACSAINEELQKRPIIQTTKMSFLPNFPLSKILQNNAGACRERTSLALYVMRATGIPVSIEHIPQWPQRDQGHEFNAVLDKNGKGIMFMAQESYPGQPHRQHSRKGKIYRKMYSKDPSSLAMQKAKNDVVPPFFMNPRLKDVTDEHVRCFDVAIPLINDAKNTFKYAYSSVFNNCEWIPIHWGKSENKQALFTKMEGGIVYLPTYYDKAGIKPANYPFKLNLRGTVEYLIPDYKRPHRKMVLTNIFNPLSPDIIRNDLLGNGIIEGANDPEFKDAEKLMRFSHLDGLLFNERTIDTKKKLFRYYRYFSPNQFGRIGELEFYLSNRKLRGKLISSVVSDGSDTSFTPSKALDGNINTYFESTIQAGAWVGVDLGKPAKIDKVRVCGPLYNSDTKLIPGHRYELFYWDNEWVSAGSTTASSKQICFKNIPSHTLYKVTDLNKSEKQRIFTYENDKQVWW